MPIPFMPLVYGAGALAMRYGPHVLRGLQRYASNLGPTGIATGIVAPAVAQEAATKGISAVTGIPEGYLDAVSYINPTRKVAKGFTGIRLRPDNKAMASIGASGVIDAADIDTGITPQEAMQGFYKFIKPEPKTQQSSVSTYQTPDFFTSSYWH